MRKDDEEDNHEGETELSVLLLLSDEEAANAVTEDHIHGSPQFGTLPDVAQKKQVYCCFWRTQNSFLNEKQPSISLYILYYLFLVLPKSTLSTVLVCIRQKSSC